MILKSKIFRAYDIRGEVFTDFDEEGVYAIAAAFGKYITEKHHKETPKIFVSGDARLSMDRLYPAVLAGFESSHCEITWGGAIPTPMNYFIRDEGDFDASLQISASHNPPQENGLKLVDRLGAVCGEEIQKIRIIAEEEKIKKIDFENIRKKYKKVNFLPQYEKKLHDITAPQNQKRILVDCGNAIPGKFYPQILESFGHTVEQLYCDLDTNFPHHQPDPERKENLKGLINQVVHSQTISTPLDFGFAFDGDGDRLGIVLSDGTILSADKILYILASDLLYRIPQATIVIDAMSSAVLVEKLKKNKGIPIFSKTGHSYIEQNMKKHQSLLGGEQSGHFMFGENFYGHDDAILAALRFLSAVQTNPLLLNDVTKDWPELYEFSEKVTVSDEKKFEMLERITNDIQKNFVDVNTMDGVRIDFGNGEWVIIRCSNTTPKIAIRMEFRTKENLEIQKAYFMGLLEKHTNPANF